MGRKHVLREIREIDNWKKKLLRVTKEVFYCQQSFTSGIYIVWNFQVLLIIGSSDLTFFVRFYWISKKDLDQKLNTLPTSILKEDNKRDYLACFEIFHHLNTQPGAL